MLDRIKQWYRRRQIMKDIIQRIQKVLRELSRYLSEFFDEGKEWIYGGASSASDEYKHFVNTKCYQAKFINQQVLNMQKWFTTNMSPKKFDIGMFNLEQTLRTTQDMIIRSINMVPYSKIDEFNLFIYDTLTNTLTDITRIYHNYAI